MAQVLPLAVILDQSLPVARVQPGLEPSISYLERSPSVPEMASRGLSAIPNHSLTIRRLSTQLAHDWPPQMRRLVAPRPPRRYLSYHRI